MTESDGEALWGTDKLREALERFSRVSRLTLSAYGPSGRRLLGPFLASPLAEVLSAVGMWEEGGEGTALEARLVREAQETHRVAQGRFADALVVEAIPVGSEGRLSGVLVSGWTIDRFSSPLVWEQVARTLGTQGGPLWLAARQSQPVTLARIREINDLLTTMATALLYQTEATDALTRAAEVKDQFLAFVSHELSSPLHAMRLQVDLLRRSGGDARAMRIADALERGVTAQTRLVEDLLDAARSISGKLSIEVGIVDLNEVVAHAVQTTAAAAVARDVTVEAPFSSGDVVIEGDPTRLDQVVTNLLGNAIKFSDPGRRVEVRLVPHEEAVDVLVRDEGVGLDPEHLEAVFERFRQVKSGPGRRNRGLGLGLALTRHIVELHGGRIWAESRGVGHGSTFTARLPRRVDVDRLPPEVVARDA